MRVLVVDDSQFMQRRLTEIIESAGDLRVVAVAGNGLDAIALAASLQPDVITMDINMGRMDGLDATERIMARDPRPIIVISSYTPRGGKAAMQALDLGVVDIVEKPSAGGVALDIPMLRDEIIRKIRTAARVRVVRSGPGVERQHRVKPVIPMTPVVEREPRIADPVPPNPALPRAILIGASTGGPPVLREILGAVKQGEKFPPVLIVQHLPGHFTRDLARQLDESTGLSVVEAQHGQTPRPGSAYVAPGGLHMALDLRGNIVLHDDPPVNFCRPSVDVLFSSAARCHGPGLLGIVLSGMGEDGAAGATEIRAKGGRVVVQDQASCVIYGMPKAVVDAGASDAVLNIAEFRLLFHSLEQKARATAGAPRSSMQEYASR